MAPHRAPPTREQLERAASCLRPIERDVLVLSARDGFSNEEIAELLGISARSVERLLARAIGKFDRALERRERPRRHPP